LASTTWDQAEVSAIADVLKSGRFTQGDRVGEFERKFADYFGARYAIITVQERRTVALVLPRTQKEDIGTQSGTQSLVY